MKAFCKTLIHEMSHKNETEFGLEIRKVKAVKQKWIF